MRRDLPAGTTHGGVMIFHKDNLALRPREDLENHSNLLVTEITICNKKNKYTLVYRRFGQTKNEFENFSHKIQELCSNIQLENAFCSIYVGDFNAHLSDWWCGDADDNFGTTLQNIFNSHGLKQLVNQPTHITDTSSSCIDLIVTDQPNLFLECDIHPSLHSNCHHQINFVTLNVQCPPPPPHPRRIWHYGRADLNYINKSICDYDWDSSLDACPNIDMQVELFNSVLNNIFTNFIPFDDIIVKPKDPPWFTKNIKVFYNKYKKTYRNFFLNGRTQHDKIHLNKMKTEYTKLVEESKENYLKSLGSKLSNPKTGMKAYWSALKRLLGGYKTTIIPPLYINNTFVTNVSEKCSLFNNFFAKQCTVLETGGALPSQSPITDKVLNQSTLTDSELSKMIIDLTSGFHVNKAHGHDGLSIIVSDRSCRY